MDRERLRSSGSAEIGSSGLRRVMIRQLSKISNNQVGARLGQSLRPDAAVDPDNQAEAAGVACLHSGDCILEHHGALDGYTEFLSGGDEGVRAGLTFNPFSAATLPSTMTSNRGRRSAASSTADALRDDVTTAILVPRP